MCTARCWRSFTSLLWPVRYGSIIGSSDGNSFNTWLRRTALSLADHESGCFYCGGNENETKQTVYHRGSHPHARSKTSWTESEAPSPTDGCSSVVTRTDASMLKPITLYNSSPLATRDLPSWCLSHSAQSSIQLHCHPYRLYCTLIMIICKFHLKLQCVILQ